LKRSNYFNIFGRKKYPVKKEKIKLPEGFSSVFYGAGNYVRNIGSMVF